MSSYFLQCTVSISRSTSISVFCIYHFVVQKQETTVVFRGEKNAKSKSIEMNCPDG